MRARALWGVCALAVIGLPAPTLAQQSASSCRLVQIAPAENVDSIQRLTDNEACLDAETKGLQRDLAAVKDRLQESLRGVGSSGPSAAGQGADEKLKQLMLQVDVIERRLTALESKLESGGAGLPGNDVAADLAELKRRFNAGDDARQRFEAAQEARSRKSDAALSLLPGLEQNIRDLQSRAEAESQARRVSEQAMAQARQTDGVLPRRPVTKLGIEVTPGQAFLLEDGGIITANLTVKNVSANPLLVMSVGIESTFVIPDISSRSDVSVTGVKQCHSTNGTATCGHYEDYEWTDISSQQSIPIQARSRLEGRTKASVVSLSIHLLVRSSAKTNAGDFQINGIEIR